MKKSIQRPAALLLALLLAIFGCMCIAHGIQTDHGNIQVSYGTIDTDYGFLNFKLYEPVTATVENPAPGVLLLHGYQNDHETCAAYAIELARRGAVVMSLDEYGHGSTTAGLINRGYVNHRVKVNFGEDSEADGTFVKIGSTKRYRLLMNFSNLSFFDDRYTKDADGNAITDSSCGGIAAYAALAAMDNVDARDLHTGRSTCTELYQDTSYIDVLLTSIPFHPDMTQIYRIYNFPDFFRSFEVHCTCVVVYE